MIMRISSLILTASALSYAVADALAQVPDVTPTPAATSPTSSSYDDGTDTVTVYATDCSTSASSCTGTLTDTITDTLPCEECEMSATEAPGILTTYTTVYVETCSTGLATKTYTITESCSTLGQSRPSTYIPSGFTVTTVSCSVCEQSNVVITTPCETSTTLGPTPTRSAQIAPEILQATPPAQPSSGPASTWSASTWSAPVPLVQSSLGSAPPTQSTSTPEVTMTVACDTCSGVESPTGSAPPAPPAQGSFTPELTTTVACHDCPAPPVQSWSPDSAPPAPSAQSSSTPAATATAPCDTCSESPSPSHPIAIGESSTISPSSFVLGAYVVIASLVVAL